MLQKAELKYGGKVICNKERYSKQTDIITNFIFIVYNSNASCMLKHLGIISDICSRSHLKLHVYNKSRRIIIFVEHYELLVIISKVEVRMQY